MATPSTVNDSLDKLAGSFFEGKKSVSRKDRAKIVTNFRRRVKRHSFGRTNQFEVEERLDGLEEKFQILSLDDLSDALRKRRFELQDYHHNWLPDVLDLLLKLSGNPAENDKLLALYIIPPRARTPSPLTWSDVVAEDPINQLDRLWEMPDFTDDTNFHGDVLTSSIGSSPESNKQVRPGTIHIRGDDSAIAILSPPAYLRARLSLFREGLLQNQAQPLRLTEHQAVSEVLLLVLGLPTCIFHVENNQITPQPSIQILQVNSDISNQLLKRAAAVRRHVDIVKGWKINRRNSSFIEKIKQEFETVLETFSAFVGSRRDQILGITTLEVISLLENIIALERSCVSLSTLAAYAQRTKDKDEVACLDSLYNMVQYGSSYAVDEKSLLGDIFLLAFEEYSKPLWSWLRQGSCKDYTSTFFIRQIDGAKSLNVFWQERFMLVSEGLSRPPDFLKPLLSRILMAGKTTALLNYLRLGADIEDHQYGTDAQSYPALIFLSTPYLPFTAAFQDQMFEQVSAILTQRTEELKDLFLETCGLSHVFEALDHLYLGRNGAFSESLDSKIFNRIDRCIDSWNDRYLVAELIEEACLEWKAPIDVEALTIHSVHTSSRRMQSRRQSVKILGALTVDMSLPWQVANIISPASMISYRRVALVLTQIRRAKFSLERVGYVSVMAMPISEDSTSGDQMRAQIFCSTLVQFIDVLYNHVTYDVAGPMTVRMRHDIALASSMDEMIEIHRGYIQHLEHACFAAPKLKLVRSALLSLLDMCIRFADLVSNSTEAPAGDHDTEVGSFTSARSQHGRQNLNEAYSDDDIDDLNEGYSSFIILDDGMTVLKELRKLKTNFARQLDFFTAGVKGIAKGSIASEEFTMLAERFDWIMA